MKIQTLAAVAAMGCALFAASLSVVALATSAQAANATRGLSFVYDFCQQANCADGQDPVGGVIADTNGNLYGTTQYGGIGLGCNANDYYGCGTAYKITPDGTETVLYSFCSQTSCQDGGQPTSGLIMDGSGNLYGTTTYGSNVFEIALDGTETELYSFGVHGGSGPSGLVMDAYGDLFGTLQSIRVDGPNGAVFGVSGTQGETIYTFCRQPPCTDGQNPTGGVILDATGNLYGTTTEGGANGSGVVFKVVRGGETTETVLYSFCSQANCTDGSQPTGSLVEDRHGNFYGVTSGGGANGAGTVFEVAANGTETVLYNFCSDSAHGHCLDGASPETGLVELGNGSRLYGTATTGGSGEYGNGVVFSLVRGTEKPLYSFGQYTDGYASTPYAGLLSYNNVLYGTAESGGWSGGGIVFGLPR